MQKPEEIFNKAVEFSDPAKQVEYLDQNCGGNEELRAEVDALLKWHQEAGSFLKSRGHRPDGSRKADGLLGSGENAGEDNTLSVSSISTITVGTKIGPYKVLQVLGEGGFAIVYLVEQTVPVRRKAALKILKLGMDSKQIAARFEAERQALALLDHPSVAHIYDAGITDSGRPYFVMEHIKGVSITEHCDEHHLNVEERLELFVQVCEAIESAHQKGIIHRDVKPSNILVSVAGDKAIPKIIDFGVAKALSQPLTERTLFTEQGQMIGTPEYMSPEQAQLSNQDIDTRSDVYSLGVLLYELLTGALPFDSKTLREAALGEIQRIIREEDPPRPSTRLTGLGETADVVAKRRGTGVRALAKRLHNELEWIPLMAMRKDRNRRYATVANLAEDVRRYLNGDPLLAGPEAASYRLKKTVDRHRTLVIGITAIFLILATGIVISASYAVKASRAGEKEKQHRITAEQAQDAEMAQRVLAESALKEVEARAEKLRIASYYSNIQLADRMLGDGYFDRALHLVETCPKDLRGWEWDYLVQKLRSTGTVFYPTRPSPLEIAMSSEGLIAFGYHRNLILWDGETASERMVLRNLEEKPDSVAISPSGDMMIAGESWTGDIGVWDSDTGSRIARFKGVYVPSSTPSGQAISMTQIAHMDSNGEHVVTCTLTGHVFLCDISTGAILTRIEDKKNEADALDRIRAVACSPDGQRILTLRTSGLKLWNADGRELALKREHCRAADFSADGDVFAYSSERALIICDASTGDELLKYDIPFDPSTIAFSRDGQHIAAGTSTGKVGAWDVRSGREELTITTNESGMGSLKFWSGISSLAFSKDDSKIISVGEYGTVGIWQFPKPDVDQPRKVAIGQFSLDVDSVAFSPASMRAAKASITRMESVNVLDDSENESLSIELKGHHIPKLAFNSGGNLLAWSCGSDQGSDMRIQIWDWDTSMKTFEVKYDEAVFALKFAPKGRSIAVGRTGGIDIWSLAEQRKIGSYEFSVDSLYAVDIAFDPNGDYVCAAGFRAGHEVRIWALAQDGNVLQINPDSPVLSVVFSPDGERIATGDDSGMVSVWDSRTGDRTETYYHGGTVDGVGFSQNGLSVLSGGSDGTVKIWDTRSGFEVLTLEANAEVKEVSFCSNGKTIAAICSDGSVRLWETTAEDESMADPSDLRRQGLDLNKYMDWRHSQQGRQAYSMNRYVEAIAEFSAAIKLNPGCADYWFYRARAYSQNGDYELAFRDYSRAIQIEPENFRLYSERADLLHREGQDSAAISDLSKAIEYCESSSRTSRLDQRDCARCLHRRGRLYYQMGRYESAFSDYAEALEIESYNAAWRNELASMYMTCPEEKFRNAQKAIEFATEACELWKWGDIVSVRTLATACAEAGDFASAVRWQKEIIKLYAQHRAGYVKQEYQDQLRAYGEHSRKVGSPS